MDNSRRGFLPFRHGIHLSIGQSHKTPEKKELMSERTYASTVGSLMYVMLCTAIYFLCCGNRKSIQIRSRRKTLDCGENMYLSI